MATRLSIEQLKQIDKSSRVDFHFRIVNFLREWLPDQTARMDDVALLQRVLESEKRAAPFGVVSEAGVTQWVCLTFTAGQKFDELPEVSAYLHEPEPPGEEKLERLVDCVDEELGHDKARA